MSSMKENVICFETMLIYTLHKRCKQISHVNLEHPSFIKVKIIFYENSSHT